MGRRGGSKKAKARKAVLVSLLERTHSGKTTQAYSIMDRLIERHHKHLADAKIAIAWRFGWKADSDGRVILGRCKKGSDLDRALHGFDFVILLNHECWNAAGFTEKQMEALIDHELSHAAVSMDSNGEPKKDEKGRTVYRTRKHDFEEFHEVVARHGFYTETLERVATLALDSKRRPLFSNGKAGKQSTIPMAQAQAQA